MEEHGFYHPSMGYWQTNSTPSEEIIAAYPEGTVEVPLPPETRGYEFNGTEWVKLPEVVITDEERRAAMTPVNARQLRLTLVRNGFSLATVEATIEALPEGQQKDEAQIEWEYADKFERLNPTLLAVAYALSLSAEQVDAMWEQALAA